RLRNLPRVITYGGRLARVSRERCDGFLSSICLRVPEHENKALLRRLYGWLEPVVLIGRQKHVDKGIVLSKREHVLRNEYFEVGVFQNEKHRSRCVLVQSCHSMDLGKIVFRLYLMEVTSRHCRQRD